VFSSIPVSGLNGGHGFGLAPGDPVLSTRPGRCEAWMGVNGWLKPGK